MHNGRFNMAATSSSFNTKSYASVAAAATGGAKSFSVSSSGNSSASASSGGGGGGATGKVSRRGPAWMAVQHKLRKVAQVANRDTIKTALEACDFVVEAAVRYLQVNRLTRAQPHRAAPGGTGGTDGIHAVSHVKRGRDTLESSAPASVVSAGSTVVAVRKKTRDNDDIGSEDLARAVSAMNPKVRNAVKLTVVAASSRPSNWAAHVTDELGAGGDGTRDDTVQFLLRVSAALEAVPQLSVKVRTVAPVLQMLCDMHNVDTELDREVDAMCARVAAVGPALAAAKGGTDRAQVRTTLEKYTCTLEQLLKFLGLVEAKIRRLSSHGKEIAEKFRLGLKSKLMSQQKVVRACATAAATEHKRVAALDAQILAGVGDDAGRVAPGDACMVKANVPQIGTVFRPATVREVDASLLRVRVHFDPSGAGAGAGGGGSGEGEWVRLEDVQAQRGDKAELRLRDSLLQEMENPAKKRLLQDRRRALAAAAAADAKLAEVRARRAVDDESRKLADTVMMREESFSAQPFQLDAAKFGGTVLRELRALTLGLADALDAAMRLQLDRRTNAQQEVEAAQTKLERHRQLYPEGMERHRETLQETLAEWQTMTKVCASDDAQLLQALGALARALSASAPQWVVARCFDVPLQRLIAALPQALRSAGQLTPAVATHVGAVVRGLAESRLWEVSDAADFVRARVVPAAQQQTTGGGGDAGARLRDATARLREAGIAINGRISIWWADDKRAYDGILVKPTTFAADGLLQVNYDDGDVRRYSVDRVIERAARALPTQQFLDSALARAGLPTGTKIGSAVRMVTDAALTVASVKLKCPTSAEVDRVRPRVAAVRLDGSHPASELPVKELAQRVRLAQRVAEIRQRLRARGVHVEGSVRVWVASGGSAAGSGGSGGGTVRAGTVRLHRQAVELTNKVSVVFEDGRHPSVLTYLVEELAQAVTLAAVHRHRSAVDATAAAATGGTAPAAPAPAPALAVAPPTASPFTMGDLFRAPAAAGEQPPAASVAPPQQRGPDAAQVNRALQGAGIPAVVGDDVCVWAQAADGGGVATGRLAVSPSAGGAVNNKVCVVRPDGRMLLRDASVQDLQRMLTVARNFEQDTEQFLREHVRGYIQPGRSLTVFSAALGGVRQAVLSASKFPAEGRFELRFHDGTVRPATAAQVLAGVERAASMAVDKALADNHITNVSSSTHSQAVLWGGAKRGLLTGTLRAGYTVAGEPQVVLLEQQQGGGASGKPLLQCRVDELAARLVQGRKFLEGQEALKTRRLRIGGPIDVWYHGTLQLEADFDTKGQLTVRYDDGDVRHYDVATLMARVDDARRNTKAGTAAQQQATGGDGGDDNDDDDDDSSSFETASSATTSSPTRTTQSARPANVYEDLAMHAVQELQLRQMAAADAAAAKEKEQRDDNSGCVVM